MNQNDRYDAVACAYGNLHDHPFLYQPIGGGSMMGNGGNGCAKESKRFKGEIIAICGPMKFADEMIKQENILTKEGYVVLMPLMKLDGPITEEDAKIIRRAHKRKIDMADSIFVINKDGYIGRHTADEIEAASQMKRYIYFLENADNESK